jgi:Rod binding domain-containing protein
MNVVPINATSASGAGQIAELAAPRSSKSKPLSGAALRNASPAEQRKEVAMQFEAILVRQLLGPTMSSMLGKEGGAASNVYGDMLTDSFAQQLTRGGGFGLGGMLEKQLAPRAPRTSLTELETPDGL